MDHQLQNMNVLVTGAASGIGRATADLLQSQQARLAVVDKNATGIEETVESLRRQGGPLPVGFCCDIRDSDECRKLADDAEQAFGRIDALVHCAAILRPPGSRPRPLHELEHSEYEAVVGTNLKGTFLVNQAMLRKMLPQKSGQIINLSSTSGQKGRPFDSLYSASKAGVIALSESIAEEMRPFGIRVQVILPDAVDTPMWKQNGPFPQAPSSSLPPQRIAEIIAFCLALPPDMVTDRLVVRPFERRKRKSTSRAQDSASSQSEDSAFTSASLDTE